MPRLVAEVDERFHKKVRDFAHEKDIDVKAVVVNGVANYIGAPSVPHPHLAGKHAATMDLLFSILENAPKDERAQVTAILQTYAAVVGLKKPG